MDKEKRLSSLSPGRSLFITALTSLFLGTASFFLPLLLPIWKISMLILIPVLIIDAILLIFWTDRLNVQRKISPTLALGRSTTVNVNISPNGKGIIPVKFKFFDIYDDSFDCASMPITVRSLNFANKTSKSHKNDEFTGWNLQYIILPGRRGNWEFKACHLLFSSMLHFWRLKTVVTVESRGRTYPDFTALAQSSNLQVLLQCVGEKKVRRRGCGLEFESLRDWQNGDTIKSIDWRATSRRQKFTVREYQEEQDQNVLFLLDSGYRLNRRNGEGQQGTQFDSALNAALLLSHVALKSGDSVSACVFGNCERWIPPRKGINALCAITNGLFDVQSAGVPSSLFSALETALTHLKRRTFIVLVSNFRKEDSEQLSWILPRITRRHLLLLVSMRESEAERLASRALCEIVSNDDVLESAAAYAYIAERKEMYKQWEHQGVLTMETSSDSISAALINRYLAVKRKGVL
ncbi:hypothetical protein FACS1894190_05730 [Spirochaetia bacterium]|nr:hypothetical protein FACS1894190_05730 [Spirochaetia bacterium]